MRNIWISSDLHYNHTNSLKWTTPSGERSRPFDSVDQLNECLIEKHNSVVRPGDIYYCLGDVFFGDKEKFKKDWPKFHGKKRLIVGNHDDVKFLANGSFFEKIMLWRMFSDRNLIFAHVPMHLSNLLRGKEEPLKQIHGHIHANPSPEGPYRNVCVEMINFTPIHIEDL